MHSQIEHDFQTMSTEEVEEIYSIVINTDGSVLDTIDNIKFRSIGEWARWAEREADHSKTFLKMPHKQQPT